MKTEYYIINPNGNITALVTTKTPENMYGAVSCGIMRNNPSVEQVGYVSFSDNAISLYMSGGEFCGNATLSAAALLYSRDGLPCKAEKTVTALPMNKTFKVQVEESEGEYFCRCRFDNPEITNDYSFTADGREYRFPLVCLDGICHIIADGTLSEKAARTAIKTIADDLSVAAVGIMIYNPQSSRLIPYVYVKGVNTLFCENSCASGSIAVCAAMGETEKPLDLIQKGGVITAQKTADGIILSERIIIIKKVAEEI